MQLDNTGWTPREGGSDDPNNSTDMTTTPRARTQQVAALTDVFASLDYLTRKAVIDEFVKAHAAANTFPTAQTFSRK
jgi:hypothetical protein